MGAAAPFIAMGASAVGGALSNRAAGKVKHEPIAPPTALFPGMNKEYLGALQGAGLSGSSMGSLSEIARTGSPVNVGPAFDAFVNASQRTIDQGRTNLIEKYGVSGMRHSSPLLNAAVDYESQTARDFNAILADFTRQASENAAARRLQAAGMGASIAGEAGLAMRPTEALVTGGTSTLGGALSSGSSAFMNIMLMRNLFPDMFGGGQSAS